MQPDFVLPPGLTFKDLQPYSHAFLTVAMCALARPLPEAGIVQFNSLPHGRFRFAGPVGERVEANIDNWLLRAPQANPGILEMFQMRDRQPVPQLVPWAGEFVGKYLISAVQALRMSDDPRLFVQVSNVVTAFIATQAENGYLGPFPKDARLLKNWDLWGHYHALYALALWHERTGDPAALAAARKAGDLVCLTYLDTSRRVVDAGDSEMNMSILTGMAMLYRLTGEPRYLRMAREVEKDWERAGDYLRAGLDGREYFQSPRPRWESLHDLQGLFEMWRITGEAKDREAFIHHWRSIRRWDRRNTGAFSSGEQATGNPYAPTAIETCCTVAWMAMTVDYLKLTGDPQAADALELAALN
ncbi:MAG: glycoside hydrolase family 127 protein, partial [Verrucomicrobia bacterium]|nr:glycoside hydrolase family 127 protein [Verrucomicrobiota bacterium]